MTEKSKLAWRQRLGASVFLAFVAAENRLIRWTRHGQRTFFDTRDFP
jgi:hypothetical protein